MADGKQVCCCLARMSTLVLDLTFPQKEHRYLECWLTSVFLICLRRLAPYRVPYLPTIPTFLVRFDCSNPNTLLLLSIVRLRPAEGCTTAHDGRSM